jgi:ribonuclease G
MKIKRFHLFVHPYVYAYINKGLFSLKFKWTLRYGTGVNVLPDQNLPFLSYRFIGTDGQEIDMKEEHEIL